MRLVPTDYRRSPHKESPIASIQRKRPKDRDEVSAAEHCKQTARETSPSEFGSWKEIAAYLNRTVRTAQRWERLEGLPVRRHIHRRASTVFAYKDEINAWWKKRTSSERVDRETLEKGGSDLSVETLTELLKILVLGVELLGKLNQQASRQPAQKDEDLQLASCPAALHWGAERPFNRLAE